MPEVRPLRYTANDATGRKWCLRTAKISLGNIISNVMHPASETAMFSHLNPATLWPSCRANCAPAGDVLENCADCFASAVYIQLDEGRMYATIGGKSLLTKPVTYIVPATDEHRAAFAVKHRCLRKRKRPCCYSGPLASAMNRYHFRLSASAL